MNKFLLNEKKYHDNVAVTFSEIRKKDFIWEIPEELFILKEKYFLDKRVLDMGCGPSISIKNILSTKLLQKCNYIGVDISKKMLRIAKYNIPTGSFMCSDISAVKINNNSIDTILSIGSLHHVEDQIATLKKWIKLLKNGGHLLLREPLYESLQKGRGASLTEEGIKLNEILNLLTENNNIKIKRLIFFGSPIFHLINRIMRKIFGKLWLNTKLLWYPLMILDVYVSTILKKVFFSFIVDSCIIIAQKI
jgi:ubiquinone/menaquinone biosynthesis C-methylase UbiE